MTRQGNSRKASTIMLFVYCGTQVNLGNKKFYLYRSEDILSCCMTWHLLIDFVMERTLCIEVKCRGIHFGNIHSFFVL